MTELEDDFKATAQDIVQDARDIERIEQTKSKLDPADPLARALAARAEEIAEVLHHKTLAQRDLVETAAADA